jgi:uncharacterized protein (DUF2236 family)
VIAPLAIDDLDAYCADAAGVALALGASGAGIPRSWAALQTYMNEAYISGSIVVGSQARELAAAVLTPPLRWLTAPAAAANRLIAVGLLPDHIREQYGFPWSRRRDRRLKRTLAAIRFARRITPSQIALWPQSRPIPDP